MRYLSAVLFLGVVLIAGAAYAVPGDSRVYYVDVQEVMDRSVLGKSARENLEQEAKKRQLRLMKQQEEIKSLADNLTKQAGVLSKEALSDREQALRQRERDLQRSAQDEQEELLKKRSEIIKSILGKIDAAVKAISQKNGYQFVLSDDGGFVIYGKKELNITDQITKYLDDQYVGL